jgi:adenine-specific DNA-methyltransferase
MSFNSKLIDLLKTNHNLVDDEGELLIAAVHDRAWKIDHDLVKLLLSDKEIKAKFFDEIEDHWIFNINTFLEYISQKNFLDNSYTRFRNRIGLTIGEKYLRERGEVSLVWAYKDTVLEGGQTKEEEKRKEIFFNEMLAQDEINRLLDPKVLTNFTRYTAKGKQPVKEFKRDENGTIRENLILKGNNLLALHTLKTQFRNQVKLIYIDPPYNTGGDSFGYNDNFNHSTWLTFIKNRLEVAKELLATHGVIVISIDQNEAFYLKVLSDEIFGRENFISAVTVQNNPKGRVLERHFATSHEYLLFYSKSRLPTELNIKKTADDLKKDYSEKDDDGYFRALELRNTHREFGKHNRPNLFFPLYVNPKDSTIYIEKSDEYSIQILPIWDDGFEGCWTWSTTKCEIEEDLLFGRQIKGKWKVFRKSYATNNGNEVVSKKLKTIWLAKQFHTEKGQKTVDELLGKGKFRSPKPVELIKTIIELVTTTDTNDIVLDFFAGSGTTGQAVIELNTSDDGNRQFILCEQLDYVETITTQRIVKVIKGLETSFVYSELAKTNESFMERIQAAKNSKELLKIWQEMAEGSFLNWYVNPEVPEEAIKDFEAIGKTENGFEKQKKLLAELLDKNQLYVNLSEMDDAQFQVSKEDKALNKAFYGEA